MVLTRYREAAERNLFEALVRGDSPAAEDACTQLRTCPAPGGLLPLHLAAAADASAALEAVAALAASGGLDAPLPRLDGLAWPQWLQAVWASLNHLQREALTVPGCTALAVAARLGHATTVRRLLQLGADASGVGQPLPSPAPKPYSPLSAVVLTSAGNERAMAAAPTIVKLLLAHGADPLAPSVRRRCSTLRCACGSEFLRNGSLALLVEHLERRAARGRLAFGTGDAAADVMIAAARCGRLRLFRLAHEFALAASGRRRQYAPEEGRAARQRRRPIDTSDDDEEQVWPSGSSSGAAAAVADAGSPSDGSGAAGGGGGDADQPGPAHVVAPLATWQPSALQLFEVLRGAALGGCPAILRCILASPLPFSVIAADSQGSGLLAHCAAHAEEECCAESLGLLHAAGAAVTLRRVLYLLEKRMSAACMQALLALHTPDVPLRDVTLKAGGVTSYTCPVNRLLHAWTRGAHPSRAADPEGWPRNVMRVLEVLLAAGLRPVVYQNMSRPVMVLHPGGHLAPAPDPFDPLLLLPQATDADKRLMLVATGGSWSTQAHAIWPPAFKQVVQTLLLSAHRLAQQAGSCGGSSSGHGSRAARAARRAARWDSGAAADCGATLGSLPLELLLQIVERAAFPVSLWM